MSEMLTELLRVMAELGPPPAPLHKFELRISRVLDDKSQALIIAPTEFDERTIVVMSPEFYAECRYVLGALEDRELARTIATAKQARVKKQPIYGLNLDVS